MSTDKNAPHAVRRRADSPGGDAADRRDAADDHDDHESDKAATAKKYWRFGAMVLTGAAVMYATMYAGTWEWSHVRFSESRVFMALTMAGTMGLVMFAWMLHMYRSTRGNIAIVVVSLLALGGGIALDRSQVTVDDSSFMSGMIPHHSLAITRSERSNLTDVRVCELAKEISEAQRREILEMEWLIEDIAENGEAKTAAEADARAVPDFDRAALRECES